MTLPAVPGTGGPGKDAAGVVRESGIDVSIEDHAMQAEDAADAERDPAMGPGVSNMREVIDEFRSIVLGQGGLLDAVFPSVVFLVTRALAGDSSAMVAGLLTGASILLFRILRRQPPLSAALGLAGSLLAYLVARAYQRAELFFLPDVITSVALTAVCLVSAAIRRPMVAWTSHLVRRWPRPWYWHPRVVPAYRETTLAWAVFFLLQAALQWALVFRQDVGLAAATSFLNAWPATAVLLVLTYLYGTWRLPRLAGPSVVEFQNGSPPPWSGQRRGF